MKITTTLIAIMLLAFSMPLCLPGQQLTIDWTEVQTHESTSHSDRYEEGENGELYQLSAARGSMGVYC